ncbi:MAG: hypothetical protein F6K39_22810 [Okeania sp. SIO3B3]|nr:hypothetical protein [Okeania sp. SIO3B3]
MNNSLIEGLTKQEETLFWGLINKILAQKLLAEAPSTSREKQLQLEFKVDENGSIEKELLFQFKVDENGSIDVNSIQLKSLQAKSPPPIISTVLSVVSWGAFTLGFVATPGIIIWILTNSSVIFTIFALTGWVVICFLGERAFFGKIPWKWFADISTAYFITILLVTLLGKLLSF